MANKLANLMADLRENESLALVKELIQRGSDPVGILEDAHSATGLVGKRFEKCEYFIPDLMMAGNIFKGISEIVRPLLKKQMRLERRGRPPPVLWLVTSMTSARKL
jgi:methanogenic corrinoid protein MtbC1